MAVGRRLEDAPDRILENAAVELRRFVRFRLARDQAREILQGSDRAPRLAVRGQRDLAAAIERHELAVRAQDAENAFPRTAAGGLARRQPGRHGGAVVGMHHVEDFRDRRDGVLRPAENPPVLGRKHDGVGSEIMLPTADRRDFLRLGEMLFRDPGNARGGATRGAPLEARFRTREPHAALLTARL